MAEFYGRIQGNRGEATRMGSKDSGFVASCQSWVGSVVVAMEQPRQWLLDANAKRRGRKDMEDKEVTISVPNGSTGYSGWGSTKYHGSLLDLVECDELVPMKNGRRMTPKRK